MRSAARLRRARAPHVRRRGFREGAGVDAYVQPQPVDASKPNRYSATLTAHARRGGAQAMLVPCGVDSEKLAQPQIGVASIWWEGNPCNMHLLDLSELVKTSLEQQDLVALRYNAVGVSDAISMGTGGMRYSLQSRDLIADSVETVAAAELP